MSNAVKMDKYEQLAYARSFIHRGAVVNYPEGVYFRVQRDGKWQPICFSDLTAEEREKVCEGRDAEWLKSLAYHLADCIKEIGEQFNIAGGEQE